jgi:hypothetical protein
MTNWKLGELLAVRRFIDPDLYEKDVRQRFSDVGGIVRHVFGKYHADVVDDQKNKVNEIPLEPFIDLELAQACVNRKGVSHRVFTYCDVIQGASSPIYINSSTRTVPKARRGG